MPDNMEEAENKVQKQSYTPVKLSFNLYIPETAKHSSNSPLVFLHGITSCKDTWENVFHLLADATNRKAYCYDLRNHGDSEWTENFTVEDLVLDLHNFLDIHNISTAILIGHSLGGTISINYALRNLERIEMVIIEDMFVKKPPVNLYTMPLAYITLAPVAVETISSDIDEETASKCIMQFIFSHLASQNISLPKCSKIDKSTMALKRSEDGRYALKANMRVIEKSLKAFIQDYSIEIPQSSYVGPSCFVYGELSEFRVGKDKEDILKYFPSATFYGVTDASHSVHSDSPEQFVDIVANFIAKNSIGKEKL